MNAMQYLLSLQPAIPMSRERPCTPTSNGELKRWLKDGSVLINGKRFAPDQEIVEVVDSLVFFPKSKSMTTIV